jgi:uncharacterized protein DUF6984
MSDQFGDYYSRLGPPRPLTRAEYDVVAKLVRNAPHARKLLSQLDNAEVRDMPDGGMGSIHFWLPPSASKRRRLGKHIIAEGSFTDADGTPVSVVLDVDDHGHLYELDVFKADGSPLIRYPDIADLEIVERHGQLGFPPQNHNDMPSD